MQLDRFDRMLLNVLQRDSSLTAEQIGKEVPLSPSAIQRRVKRLREEGFIIAEAAIVDPRKVGRPTSFIVSLEVERERQDLLDKLRSWLRARDEVQQVFYATGPADFILLVTAQTTDAYDALMSRLLAENTNVRRFTTNVVLSTVKRGLVVPVPLSDESAED